LLYLPPQAAPLGTPIVAHLGLNTIESQLDRLRPKAVDAHAHERQPAASSKGNRKAVIRSPARTDAGKRWSHPGPRHAMGRNLESAARIEIGNWSG